MMNNISPGKQLGLNSSVDPKEHFLRYNGVLPAPQAFTYEVAIQYLRRAVQIATDHPFHWLAIDKPSEGDLYLVFHSGQPSVAWPADGLKYLDQESRFAVNLMGSELEIKETKYGFIPGIGETQGMRIRRKFRLLKGGVPSLWLIHYTRGAAQTVPPIWQGPARKYPISVPNVPPTNVMGSRVPPKTPVKVEGQMQRAMLMAQQQQQQQQQQQSRPKIDEDSDDEPEYLTKRELAKVRYARNHEFMYDLLTFPVPISELPPSVWNGVTEADLEAKIAKLDSEIEVARAANFARAAIIKTKRRHVDSELIMEEEHEEEEQAQQDEQVEQEPVPDIPVDMNMDVDIVSPAAFEMS